MAHDGHRPVPRQFPFEPALDLFGNLRALLDYEKSKPFRPVRRFERIERLAHELSDASASAAQHDPGAAPNERALSRV